MKAVYAGDADNALSVSCGLNVTVQHAATDGTMTLADLN